MTMLQWCSGFVFTSCFFEGERFLPGYDSVGWSCLTFPAKIALDLACLFPANRNTLDESPKGIRDFRFIRDPPDTCGGTHRNAPTLREIVAGFFRYVVSWMPPISSEPATGILQLRLPGLFILPLVCPICWSRPLSWGHIILSCSGAIVCTLKNARFL